MKILVCLLKSEDVQLRYPLIIAEGSAKSSERDFTRSLEMNLGSSFELEAQLLLAKELDFLSESVLSGLILKLHEVQKIMVGLTKSLR